MCRYLDLPPLQGSDMHDLGYMYLINTLYVYAVEDQAETTQQTEKNLKITGYTCIIYGFLKKICGGVIRMSQYKASAYKNKELGHKRQQLLIMAQITVSDAY